MDYFKKYGLNEEDINEIENYIEDDDINNYYVNELEIIQILDYLTEIGLNNIKKSFEDRKDVVKLINEDITNFELIGY